MVSLNGFKVVIKEGCEVQRNGATYIELQHGQRYTIGLGNNRTTRCRIDVWVDGTKIGSFIQPAFDFDEIEHPVKDQGCFTFYRVDSVEGSSIGLQSGESNNGLIKVVFTPEKQVLRTPSWADEVTRGGSQSFGGDVSRGGGSKSANPYNAGGTGLSGHSSQQYGRTSDIPEHMLDRDNETTIYLRLVERKAEFDRPRSLKSISNIVPPAVG